MTKQKQNMQLSAFEGYVMENYNSEDKRRDKLWKNIK